MSRREKLLANLDREEAELRVLLIPKLRDVAEARTTGLFVTELNNPWSEVRPSKDGTEILAKARDILRMAENLDVEARDLLATKVMESFEGATDLTDKQRLGPIRLARKLL
ncbi:MAG: hypothetical protein JWO97_2029, partial [Acidobacteria bacterium]|nr:hypothetical protein [Acidobacteriota bacterium]